MKSKIKIGITNCKRWERYANWFTLNDDHDIEAIKLSYHLNNSEVAKECDGIVITGGQDVHPRFYGKPEYFELLNPIDIDEQRDDFELKVLQQSQQHHKPLLGICRGLQISNVFFGGTLIPDIPSKIDSQVHAKQDGKDGDHVVQVLEGTQLHDIVAANSGMVNSAHHQSADHIADVLKLSGWSKEDIVEALEWEQPDGKPALLLVQWHPERMMDQRSTFSKNIREYFVKEIRKIS